MLASFLQQGHGDGAGVWSPFSLSLLHSFSQATPTWTHGVRSVCRTHWSYLRAMDMACGSFIKVRQKILIHVHLWIKVVRRRMLLTPPCVPFPPLSFSLSTLPLSFSPFSFLPLPSFFPSPLSFSPPLSFLTPYPPTPRLCSSRGPNTQIPVSMCARHEDRHKTAWWRCLWGEEEAAHWEVCPLHFTKTGGPYLWPAGEGIGAIIHSCNITWPYWLWNFL